MTVARSCGSATAAAASSSTGAAASRSPHRLDARRHSTGFDHDEVAQRGQVVADLEHAVEELGVLDDRDRAPGSARPGTRSARATTSCRSRSGVAPEQERGHVGDVELGPVAACSITTRSPGPTPRAAQPGGDPGGLVGVVVVGERSDVVTHLLPERDVGHRARSRCAGIGPEWCLALPRAHVIHNSRWRTADLGWKTSPRWGRMASSSSRGDRWGTATGGLLYADSPRDELAPGLPPHSTRGRFGR